MRYCLALAVLMLGAAPAAAGSCCGYGYRVPAFDFTPEPVVPNAIYRFESEPPARQVYVVNQGPVVSGPGIYAYTNTYVPGIVVPRPRYIHSRHVWHKAPVAPCHYCGGPYGH